MSSTALRGLMLAGKADLDGTGVRLKSLRTGKRCDGWRELRKRPAIEMLHRNYLDVVGIGKPSAQTGDAAGREHMIRSRCIIAGRFRTERPNENTAGVADLRKQIFVMNGQVLRG